jgi:hypothetical protein
MPVVEISSNGRLFGCWVAPSSTIKDSTHFEGLFPLRDNVQPGNAI